MNLSLGCGQVAYAVDVDHRFGVFYVVWCGCRRSVDIDPELIGGGIRHSVDVLKVDGAWVRGAVYV